MANSHLSGCGMNDGPFTAVLIDQNKISENSRSFKLNNNAVLILDNRNDSLSPTLTLKENGIIKWTLDTDTRNTKGYESEQIWEISNLSITKTADPIKLEFTAHWTYGAEAGWMEINRENGKNSFCLSW
nr:hypothetical protein [Allomuricauda sp.]